MGVLTIGSAVVAELGSSLLEAGLTQDQVTVITNGASSAMQSAAGSIAVQINTPAISVVTPPIVTGATSQLNASGLGLADATRSKIAGVVVKSVVTSAGSRTTGMATNDVVALNKTLVVHSITSFGAAGLTGANAAAALTAVTGGAIAALAKSNLPASVVLQNAASIAQGVVANLSSAAVPADQLGNALAGVMSGIVGNLATAGVGADQISSGAGAIASQAVDALAQSGVGTANLAAAAAGIGSGAVSGLSQAGAASSGTAVSAVASITQAIVGGLVQAGLSASDASSASDAVAASCFSSALSTGLAPQSAATSLATQLGAAVAAGATASNITVDPSGLSQQIAVAAHSNGIADTSGITAGVSNGVAGTPSTRTATAVATAVTTVPPDVTSFVLTPASATEIDATWSAAGGSATGYKLVRSQGSTPPADCSGAGLTISGASTATQAVTGLTIGTTYSFRICSVSSAGLAAGVTGTATTDNVPSLSYAGATGTEVLVNTALSVAPTTLLTNGGVVSACAVTGATPIPSGLSVDPHTCVITGTPSAAIAATVLVLQATNAYGMSTNASVTLAVDPNICDSGDYATTCTVSTSHLIPNGVTVTIPGNLVVASGGTIQTNATESFTLTVTGTVDVQSGGQIAANLTSLTGSAIGVESGGQIVADGLGAQGVSQANGNGAGGGGFNSYLAGSGGGYGGAGGTSYYNNGSVTTVPGGSTYGSPTGPTSLGSAGGGCITRTSRIGAGGSGGGAIKIVTPGVLTVGGNITANGLVGTYTGGDCGMGGGSGGSIWLQASSIVGTGTITAQGAGATSFQNVVFGNGQGGGGGGGRIALQSSTKFKGTISVAGGNATFASGASGTYRQTIANGFCDSGALTGTCTISSPTYLANGDSLTGSGAVVVASGGTLQMPEAAAAATVNLSGDFTVQTGGTVSAAFGSFTAADVMVQAGATFSGSGAGTFSATSLTVDGTMSGVSQATLATLTIDAGGDLNADGAGAASQLVGGTGGTAPGNHYGGGGGYGGAGGNSSENVAGGGTYGSATAPTDVGSPGGDADYEAGGAGGGLLKLTVSGTATINGILSANGIQPTITGCPGPAGGGSGGSLLLTAGIIAGSGTIEAVGGGGSNDASGCSGGVEGGGGGGGGRMVLAWTSGTFGGSIAATGGVPGPFTTSGNYHAPGATVGGAGTIDINTTITPGSYAIGGTISGLGGNPVVLQDNSGDNLDISANGTFAFATPLTDGSTYSVTVLTNPSGLTCVVSSGSGTASRIITTVSVTCS